MEVATRSMSSARSLGPAIAAWQALAAELT
jgi:hypothetical protein